MFIKLIQVKYSNENNGKIIEEKPIHVNVNHVTKIEEAKDGLCRVHMKTHYELVRGRADVVAYECSRIYMSADITSVETEFCHDS